MKRSNKYLWLAAVAAVVAVLCTGCNARKKNTAAARQYTAFITRYNIHYNGDTHYKETLKEMEQKYEDDYTMLLYMHPADARANDKAPQPTGDFNRSIEKAQKAIQLRSITKKPPRRTGGKANPAYKEWMKRDEYNPFIHNSWLMMGRSQYMNGDFLGAAATFFYISKHFRWLSNTTTEAQLWQARAYLAMDWNFEAETILNRIKPDAIKGQGTLETLYAYDMAALTLHQKEYQKAIPFLQQAIRHSRGVQKSRLWFLLGQTYQRLDQKDLAYQAFKKAGGSTAASYRTKLNARIRQSEVFQGADITPEVKALRRMASYGRNKEYLDQIYYAIGNLYLSRGDTAHAIENYILATEKSTRGGIDKALVQLTLGNLYYQRHKYELAQPCYAEAVPQLPADFPDLATLKRRSDVLDELAVYSQNVTLQDSLLHLASLTPEERNAVIDDIIFRLKKKEKEEADNARREAYLADQAAQTPGLQPTTQTQEFQINTDNSWYFYNPQVRNAGKTDFQRRWGARRLEDDWRRRNKTSFSIDDPNAPPADVTDNTIPNDSTDASEPQPDAEMQRRADDPHYPEFYLKQIPVTPEQQQIANDVIQEGLYNMGVILKDKLDDPQAALSEFDRLLTRYPDNIFRLDTYYNLYLIFVRQGNMALANRYRTLIINDFPDSRYGQALRNPDYIENLRLMDQRQEDLYRQAYQAYLDNNNPAVHNAYENVARQFPMSKLMPKFMFLHALAYATEHRPDDFNATLREMLEKYPQADVAPIASEWVKGLSQGRKLAQGATGQNMRGMLWDIALGNDTAQTPGTERQGPQFTLNEADPYVLVFVFPTHVVNPNNLLFMLARHNFTSFVVKDFDLEPLTFGPLGMVVVKPFADMAELNHYRRVMAASKTLELPAGVRAVAISQHNFDELIRSGASLDDYFRYLDSQNYLDAQSNLIPYTEVETLPERLEQNAADQAEQTPEPDDTTPTKAPAQPAPPTAKPAPAPAKPSPTAPKPTPTPAKPKQPQKPAPALPGYLPGSEGDDDPLLD